MTERGRLKQTRLLDIRKPGYTSSRHGSIIVFEPRKEATDGTKYVRMLYLTSHFFGMGSGTLNVHENGRDEDDDGFPDATYAAKPARKLIAS
jgi:hypothetical protein